MAGHLLFIIMTESIGESGYPDYPTDQEEAASGVHKRVATISSYTKELIEMLKQDQWIPPSVIDELSIDYKKEKRKAPSMAYKDAKVIFQEYRLLAKRAVRINAMALGNYPGLEDDEEIVIEAIKQNADAFYFASDRLKNTEKVFLTAVQKNKDTAAFGSVRLRKKYGYYRE